MDRNQRGVCLSDNSWTPTGAFSPGKSYDCIFIGGDVQCVTRDQESEVVCKSPEECGFELDIFPQGTKCFIHMREGISGKFAAIPT